MYTRIISFLPTNIHTNYAIIHQRHNLMVPTNIYLLVVQSSINFMKEILSYLSLNCSALSGRERERIMEYNLCKSQQYSRRYIFHKRARFSCEACKVRKKKQTKKLTRFMPLFSCVDIISVPIRGLELSKKWPFGMSK